MRCFYSGEGYSCPLPHTQSEGLQIWDKQMSSPTPTKPTSLEKNFLWTKKQRWVRPSYHKMPRRFEKWRSLLGSALLFNITQDLIVCMETCYTVFPLGKKFPIISNNTNFL